MKKIFIKFLLLSFFLIGYVQAADNPDRLSIFFDVNIPEYIMPIRDDNSIRQPEIQNEYGIGVRYKGLRLSGSTYVEGYRIYMGYDFFKDQFVNPYLGLAYIGGVRERYNSVTKQTLDGADGVVGFSFNFFGVVSPYIDYSIYNNYFHYGVRIYLDKALYRK